MPAFSYFRRTRDDREDGIRQVYKIKFLFMRIAERTKYECYF